jgi:hypothetical protein
MSNAIPSKADHEIAVKAQALENACLAVADAARELEQIEGVRVKEGVVVTLESWRDLQDALAAWRKATDAMLIADRAAGA